jgi:hypothetical protein
MTAYEMAFACWAEKPPISLFLCYTGLRNDETQVRALSQSTWEAEYKWLYQTLNRYITQMTTNVSTQPILISI